jgi:hypothetical protein
LCVDVDHTLFFSHFTFTLKRDGSERSERFSLPFIDGRRQLFDSSTPIFARGQTKSHIKNAEKGQWRVVVPCLHSSTDAPTQAAGRGSCRIKMFKLSLLPELACCPLLHIFIRVLGAGISSGSGGKPFYYEGANNQQCV